MARMPLCSRLSSERETKESCSMQASTGGSSEGNRTTCCSDRYLVLSGQMHSLQQPVTKKNMWSNKVFMFCVVAETALIHAWHVDTWYLVFQLLCVKLACEPSFFSLCPCSSATFRTRRNYSPFDSVPRCALKACGNLGDYSRANELLLQMVEEKLTPDIVHWNHALRASAASARWEQARSLLREMQVQQS